MTRSAPATTADQAAPADPAPGARRPRAAAWAVVALGVWTMLGPLIWVYGGAGGLDARWNDVATGGVVTILGLLRLHRRGRSQALTVAAVLAGGWLVIAPFVAGHGFAEHSTRAAISNVLVGTAVAVLALNSRDSRDSQASRDSRDGRDPDQDGTR